MLNFSPNIHPDPHHPHPPLCDSVQQRHQSKTLFSLLAGFWQIKAWTNRRHAYWLTWVTEKDLLEVVVWRLDFCCIISDEDRFPNFSDQEINLRKINTYSSNRIVQYVNVDLVRIVVYIYVSKPRLDVPFSYSGSTYRMSCMVQTSWRDQIFLCSIDMLSRCSVRMSHNTKLTYSTSDKFIQLNQLWKGRLIL